MHKLSKISSNPGKVHCEILVHLLVYIGGNRNLGLKYYSDMKDAPSSDLLRQAHIKSENQLLVSLILFGKIVQTLIEVQEHILFFNQGGPIYHGTHVPGPVSKSSVET